MKYLILFLTLSFSLLASGQNNKANTSNVQVRPTADLKTIQLGKIQVSTSDVAGYFTVKDAQSYIERNPQWRLPTIEELQLIYENRSKLSNLKYGWDSYLASGTQNNFKFPNSNTEYGRGTWSKEFGTGRWVNPSPKTRLCLRLVKSENSNFSSSVTTKNSQDNTRNYSRLKYMYCSSGNCDNGFGTMIFPSNTGYREYTGTWKEKYKDRHWNDVKCQTLNCRFVKGKLVFTDGSYYEGSFDPDGQGYYQGYGVLFKANGNYKKGDFFKGVLNGFGEEKKSDGIIYKGRFYNGKRQGVCTLTYPNGKQVKGRYWDGQFISDNENYSNAKLDQAITGLNPINKTEYSTVNINGKEWMSENLNSTRFRNGDIIPQAKTEKELIEANANHTPIWCYYDFNPATETYYGKLYNWYAVNDPRGLMPLGYVIPSVNDWQLLSNLSLFKNGNGRAQLEKSEGKEIRSGKINTRFFFRFENGPSKEKKYDKVFGVPENQMGFYWTSDVYQNQYNDRINVYVVDANGSVQLDKYSRKGACVSVRGIIADHNYYVGSWIGSLKSGNGTEFYGVPTELKGFGTVYKGDKYIGLWKNGKQNGEGTIILSNGSKKTGLWLSGEFIGEWLLVDNRHKCYQCNTTMSKSTKRSAHEISNFKANAKSNKIALYNTESYCSTTCEAQAEAERKARQEKYARERQNYSSSSNSSGSSKNSTKNIKSDKNVYICSSDKPEKCCRTVVVTSSSPKTSGCCPRTDGNGCSSGHSWHSVGKNGEKTFQCSFCTITVNTDFSPRGGGCCPINGCIGHSWREIN